MQSTGCHQEIAMTAPAMPRSTRLALTTALIILGVLFVVVGVIYETQAAGHLPAFLPGHQAGSTAHHVKHGIAAFALALVAWIGAWFSTGRRRGSRRADDDDY
jgi:K+-transporting ATPase c subunit